MRSALPVLLLSAVVLAGCATTQTRKPLSILELRTHGSVLQTHEYSCGAAAMSMMMETFGHPATEEGVLDLAFEGNLPMQQDEKGNLILRALTLKDLEKAARLAGFKVVSARVEEPSQALAAIEALKPAISRMRLYDRLLHFVYIRDVQEGWVYVSDPGYGNFKIPWDQFQESWKAGDGVLLAIGTYPFNAWKSQESAGVLLKRNENEIIPSMGDITPGMQFRSVMRRIGYAAVQAQP